MPEIKQQTLLGGKYDQEPWEEEWEGMPEFKMQNREPYKQLIISFKDEEDYAAFAELIKQPLSQRTQSVWYPQAEIEGIVDKIYE